MKYRTLGKTDLEVSVIAFGCGLLAGLMIKGEQREREKVVARALEAGINIFDTSPAYGNGESERSLGSTLRALGETPHIATKIVLQPEDFEDLEGAVVRSVEGSLTRLGIGALSLANLHNRVALQRSIKPSAGVRAILSVEDVAGPVAAGLDILKRRGLVSRFGLSTFESEVPALRRILESDLVDAVLVHLSLLNPTAVRRAPAGFVGHDYGQLLQIAREKSVGIASMRVLEAGALARQGDTAPSQSPEQTYASAMIERLGFLDQLPDCTPAQAAIRYALSVEDVATAIIGVSSARQLEDALGAANLGVLSDEIMVQIDDVFETVGSPAAP